MAAQTAAALAFTSLVIPAIALTPGKRAKIV
jgi:hypothetical protein